MVWIERPSAPRFEHRTEDLGVLGLGQPLPRLSWTVPQASEEFFQSAYELEISREGSAERFVVASNEQVLVDWPGVPLTSRERIAVRVRVAHGSFWSDWSDESVAEMGLLRAEDWTGRFISPVGLGGIDEPAPTLLGSLSLPRGAVKARLYATAHGVYRARLNGRPVSDAVLAPGWTSYEHRLRYHVYDVTALVKQGVNTLEVTLGNGWYRGRLGWEGKRAIYGDRLSLLAQLEVVTDDGRSFSLATNGQWEARESEIVSDDLYDGQYTDLRNLEVPVNAESFPVEILHEDLGRLVAQEGPVMRPTEILPAQRIWRSPSGRTLVDFGQNAVGWVRLRVRGLPAGSEVVLSHAEALEEGELAIRPLRSARAVDSYIVTGGQKEILEPSFTLHGFRYVEVSGVPDLQAEDLHTVVIGTDLPRRGWFNSSHELLNRFHENVVWSTRGNFIDVPTDCPQRDERLGWTGDIQIFAPTASFLYDVSGFLTSWLGDLSAEQLQTGSVPHVIPDVVRSELMSTPAAAWGDAAVIVPWTLYQRAGDLGILARQFDSMKAWVDGVLRVAGPDLLWAGGFQYGDWLDPTAPPEDPFRAKADPDVVATGHLARSLKLVAETAALLGRTPEAERYTGLAKAVRDAFARVFITPSGRVLSDAQTVYALALEWSLFPEEDQRREAERRLADLVRASGFHISTGFVGTPLICDALTSAGYPELAHRLLLQTGCPSWLYPVTMGATTIWERWDSMLPDGTVNPGEMTSFNHYALGAVADWLHRSVAGLAPAAAGYRRILVRPLPPEALSHASALHLTPYGEASVSWQRKLGRFHLSVTVPVGATARVYLPGSDHFIDVRHGSHQWDVADPHDSKPVRTPKSIREVLDNSSIWPSIVAIAMQHHLVDGEAKAARRLAPYLDDPAPRIGPLLMPEATDIGFYSEIDSILAEAGAISKREIQKIAQ